METAYFSKISVPTYQTTRCHDPKDLNITPPIGEIMSCHTPSFFVRRVRLCGCCSSVSLTHCGVNPEWLTQAQESLRRHRSCSCCQATAELHKSTRLHCSCWVYFICFMCGGMLGTDVFDNQVNSNNDTVCL